MMDELEGLNDIEVNSRRGGGQNFDLQHNPDTNKFTVADAFYSTNDMNNNGFVFHVGNGNAYVSIRPNEEAVAYKGREGFEKGKEFTSTASSEVLDKLGLNGNLSLTEVGEKGGYTYFRVEKIEDSEQDTDETVGELAAENNADPVTTPQDTETATEEELV